MPFLIYLSDFEQIRNQIKDTVNCLNFTNHFAVKNFEFLQKNHEIFIFEQIRNQIKDTIKYLKFAN